MPTPHARSRPASLLGVALGCAILLLIAGCGSSSPKRTGSGSATNGVSAAFKFASCMRNHGASNFPEPQVSNRPGGQSISIRVPASLGDSPAFRVAQKACSGILPGPQNGNPVQIAQQQHQREQDLLAFTTCLRSHGLPDFPDPTSQGQLTLDMITSAGVDLHAPQTLTAAKACIGASHGAVTPAAVEQAVNGSP